MLNLLLQILSDIFGHFYYFELTDLPSLFGYNAVIMKKNI